MITRTPYDRDNLKIGKKDKVLEVGPDFYFFQLYF